MTKRPRAPKRAPAASKRKRRPGSKRVAATSKPAARRTTAKAVRSAGRHAQTIGAELGLAISLERMHAQRLIAPLASPAAVVEHLLAVQAQDYAGAKWALAQRSGASEAEIERAFDAGEILRTHVLRPTWHFATRADLPWLLALTGPIVQRKCAAYYKQVGLTAAKLSAYETAIAKALDGVALTRAELGRELGLDETGLTLGHVMFHAELERVVVSGPRRGKQQTYARFEDRVAASAVPMPGDTPASREPALAALARRYVASHGPARVIDFAWWSGLPLGEARKALELAVGSELVRSERDGNAYVQPAVRVAVPKVPVVRLLPNYDELLVAFADRSAAHDPRVRELDKAAIFANVVTSNGRVIGAWRRESRAKEQVIRGTLLIAPTAAERAAIDVEVARLGSFAGMPVRLELGIDPGARFRG